MLICKGQEIKGQPMVHSVVLQTDRADLKASFSFQLPLKGSPKEQKIMVAFGRNAIFEKIKNDVVFNLTRDVTYELYKYGDNSYLIGIQAYGDEGKTYSSKKKYFLVSDTEPYSFDKKDKKNIDFKKLSTESVLNITDHSIR
jgi:hypothetical protein